MIGLVALRDRRGPAQATGCVPGESTAPANWVAHGRSPDIVLIVTGMGMRGELEENLRDRTGRMFSPPVPVLVHRYGVARSGSLFRPCQRVATRRLAARLRDLSDAGGPQPRTVDVIAHSFGAWLVGQALRQNPDVRVGRIIMAGSVLRPDFDWHTIIAGDQAEAVLNNYGSRDLWAFVSEFFIPDSGPAGFRGFIRCPAVFNRRERGFRHLTFFSSSHIENVHRTLWQPFLTLPADQLPGLVGGDAPQRWRPRPWLLRANLGRALLLAGLVAGFGGLALGVLRLTGGLLS